MRHHQRAVLALGWACLASHVARAQNATPVSVPPSAPAPSAPVPLAPAAAPPLPPPPPFRLFRYEEDFSAFADPARRVGPLDDLKYIPLSSDPPASLTLGGEARTRFEYSSAPAFGLRSSSHDDFLLQRFLLHADARLGERDRLHGRAFVQLLSGLVTGEELPKPGNQDNALDIQQAFVDLTLGDDRAPALNAGGTAVNLRVGRQEMGFGSYRLVTSREPTNARLAFEGIRATLFVRGTTLDAFAVRPLDQKIGLMNDDPDTGTAFWGLYAAFPLAPERRLGFDAYYLGLDRQNARFQSGIGNELRHSLGVRLWGRADGWDHDTEAVLQFGSFDRAATSEDILAWTIASNTGYTFSQAGWKPRLGIKLNIASGDSDQTDDRLGTFNPLFPRNNYFSDANLLAPYNFFDVHPTLTVKPTDDLTVSVAWDAYFRASTDDAVFSPTGLVIPAGASAGRFVGSTVSLVADWAISRHLTLSASYAHFFRGQVVTDAGGDDVDYFGLWLTAKF